MYATVVDNQAGSGWRGRTISKRSDRWVRSLSSQACLHSCQAWPGKDISPARRVRPSSTRTPRNSPAARLTDRWWKSSPILSITPIIIGALS